MGLESCEVVTDSITGLIMVSSYIFIRNLIYLQVVYPLSNPLSDYEGRHSNQHPLELPLKDIDPHKTDYYKERLRL